MSTFLGPLLMPKHKETQFLKISLIVLALSLLGLLYVVGKHAWLPRMGGAFAKAHRQVRKTANDAAGLQQAVSIVHQALNTTAGMSVFNDNTSAFLNANPKFNPLREELRTFFGLSRQVYFEPMFKLQDAYGAAANPHQWLVQFTRRCRDCERSLVPEPIKAGA